MKKLLAAGCCILAFQSFFQANNVQATDHLNGRKVLIKAIAVIVNAEANRKTPPKQIHVPNSDSPKK